MKSRRHLRLATPSARTAIALVLIGACSAGCSSSADDDDTSARAGAAGSSAGTGGSTAAGGAAGRGGTTGGSGGTVSGGGGTSDAGAFLDCSGVAEFRLVGDLAGQNVELTKAPTTGGFSQQSNAPGPHFRVPNDESEETDQLVAIFLNWPRPVTSGTVTPVEGWLRLPIGSPFASETLCVGAGSAMSIPRDQDEERAGDFQFRLVGLARGSDCSEPVSGELRGCWRN